MNETEVRKVFAESYSFSDVCRGFNKPINGTGIRFAKKLMEDYKIDTSHFQLGVRNIKYKTIMKNCPVCGKEFQTQENHPKAKMTCSYACSNTHFRSGANHSHHELARESGSNNFYRTECFHYHKKECVICGEKNIVAVHHYDENHKNNNIENLVPMCPTHHQYMHSRYRHLIENKVNEYVESFKNNRD